MLCTSDKIDGPYTYQGTIVYSGFTNNKTNNVSGTGCADVYEISKEAGANICQWEYWGGDGQKYRIGQPKEIADDVTADGSTNIADVIALQKYLLAIDNSLPNPKAADMNGDGRLNAVDLTLLKRILLHQ